MAKTNGLWTAEQICEIAGKRANTFMGERRIINRMYRQQDDSDKFPINGKFNATERAIRKVVKMEKQYAEFLRSLEYAYTIEMVLGHIVNDERNW